MNKRFFWGLLLFNLVALPLLYHFSRPNFLHGTLGEANDVLADYGGLPDFELIRESGASFGSGDMKGSVWVADFIFTRCPMQCPMMSVKFSAMQRDLPKDVKLISFSVDPANDTPEVFKEYSSRYKADPSRWVFLTGDADALRGIKEASHTGKGDDPALHSLRFVLLDKELHVRGYYDSADTASLKKIKKDIGLLEKYR